MAPGTRMSHGTEGPVTCMASIGGMHAGFAHIGMAGHVGGARG